MNRINKDFFKVPLTDLISLPELQEMQDSFSEVASVSFRTVDPKGLPVTAISNLPGICTFKEDVFKARRCGTCLPAFLGGDGIVDEDLSFECLPGLRRYLVPLKVMLTETESFIAGYMVIGPVVFMKRKGGEEFEAIARERGLDPVELWNSVLELRVFSYQGIHSLLTMVENLTSRILSLAYGELSAQKMSVSELKQNALKKIAPGSASIDDFLGLFLDLVVRVVNANSGSVMLLDAGHKELVVRASCGLPEVFSGARLKVGCGIAGLAAETKRSFLINRDSVDEMISDRLERPHLFSSIVVPIKRAEVVYGVVNVARGQSMPLNFDESSLVFLSKAAELAGMAISNF